MIFHLKVRTDNAAFDEEAGGSLEHELGRILRKVADQIESGEDFAQFRTIFDVAGNDVGRFALKSDDYR